MSKQFSIDEQAAAMAGKLLAKGGKSGDMPMGRGGADGAEGGFTSQAGGRPIDDSDLDKAGPKTSAAITAEPGPQNQNPKTGTAITNEEDGDDSDGGAGTPGLPQDEDEGTRSRKPGQVGVSGGSVGGGMSEGGDSELRARKPGKVGISKSDDEDEDDEGDEGGGEDDEGDEDTEKACKKSAIKKSSIAADDLMKSLDILEAIADGSGIAATPDRRAELGQKLSAGTLTKAEMGELSDLMKSATAEASAARFQDEPDAEDFQKSFQEHFAEDDAMREAYDVSPIIERTSQLVAAGLDSVRESLSKSLDAQQDRTRLFNTQLAKSLRGMTQVVQRQEQLIKSLADRLETVEGQPVGRRGFSGARALEKSMRGEAGGGADLGRNQILDTLEQMAMRSERAPSGAVLAQAVTEYEMSGALTKSLYNDVVRFRAENNGRAH
jgi:hypothetical protein